MTWNKLIKYRVYFAAISMANIYYIIHINKCVLGYTILTVLKNIFHFLLLKIYFILHVIHVNIHYVVSLHVLDFNVGTYNRKTRRHYIKYLQKYIFLFIYYLSRKINEKLLDTFYLS